MPNSPLTTPCPCGSGPTYDGCCGPLHRGAAQADSAEELMRSRYSAYAVGDSEYVWRTWHPRTRPETIDLDPALTWTGLRIDASGPDWVDFTAGYLTRTGAGELHELSRFEHRAGRWFYVDGDVG